MYQKRTFIRRRLELPKSRKEIPALLCFTVGGVYLLWYEACHILPTYYSSTDPDYWEVYVHYMVAAFLAVNIYGNMYKLITTDVSHRRYLFTSGLLLPDGWRYCALCDFNLPPRSHHCKICDVCILKRDHHCWFAGYCIGYHNHRYYFAMVIHMVIAALYCNIFNLTFVVSIKGHLTLRTLFSYIGPHIGWLFGYYGNYVFYITAMTTVGTVLLFLFSWLLSIQLQQLYYGQTQFEMKKKRRMYNQGLYQNIREVLGKKWYLVLLFPWLPSALPGDGAIFRVKDK